MIVNTREIVSKKMCEGEPQIKHENCKLTCKLTWKRYKNGNCSALYCGEQGIANYDIKCFKVKLGDTINVKCISIFVKTS